MKERVCVSNIISPPLAFVRSGSISASDGKVYHAGHTLYDWSHVSNSTMDAYNLYIYPTDVYTSNIVNRYYGFPLRCLCILDYLR